VKQPIIVIGLGQIGAVFAKGFLRIGHPVYPIIRGDSLVDAIKRTPDPIMVLVAVREEDLQPVLNQVPPAWHKHIALIQNELVPSVWEDAGIQTPTVVTVWFEKRKGKAPNAYFPSMIYGPQADLIANVFDKLNLPFEIIKDEQEMIFELVRKNLYLISKNILGLALEGTVGEIWEQNRELFEKVADEVFLIQCDLVGFNLDKQRLFSRLAKDIETLPDAGTTGSSAAARLERMLQHATSTALDVPTLQEIQMSIST
jgi:ketopantoate reductase